MPRQNKCSHCHQLGHNRLSCPIKKTQLESIREELGERMADSQAEIEDLRRKLAEEWQRGKDRIKWIVLKDKLRRARREKRRVEKDLYLANRRAQPLIVKAFPMIVGLVTAGITLVTKWYDRIPYAQTIGMLFIGLIPVFVFVFLTEYVRSSLTLAMGKSEAIAAGVRSKSKRRERGNSDNAYGTSSDEEHKKYMTNDLDQKRSQ